MLSQLVKYFRILEIQGASAILLQEHRKKDIKFFSTALGIKLKNINPFLFPTLAYNPDVSSLVNFYKKRERIH